MDHRGYHVGDRIEIVYAAERFQPEVHRNENERIMGCIAKVSESSAALYYGIVLDDALNSAPSSFEVTMSKQLHLPKHGAHVIMIPSSCIDKYVQFRLLSENDEGMDNMGAGRHPHYTMCRLLNCNVLSPRRDKVITCSLGHMVCASHLIPWNASKHAPDEVLVSSFFKLLERYVVKCHPAMQLNVTLTSRALLGYARYATATSAHGREIALSLAATKASWTCGRCTELAGHDRHGNCYGISQYHVQFFPSHSRAHSSTHSSSSHHQKRKKGHCKPGHISFSDNMSHLKSTTDEGDDFLPIFTKPNESKPHAGLIANLCVAVIQDLLSLGCTYSIIEDALKLVVKEEKVLDISTLDVEIVMFYVGIASVGGADQSHVCARERSSSLYSQSKAHHPPVGGDTSGYEPSMEHDEEGRVSVSREVTNTTSEAADDRVALVDHSAQTHDHHQQRDQKYTYPKESHDMRGDMLGRHNRSFSVTSGGPHRTLELLKHRQSFPTANAVMKDATLTLSVIVPCIYVPFQPPIHPPVRLMQVPVNYVHSTTSFLIREILQCWNEAQDRCGHASGKLDIAVDEVLLYVMDPMLGWCVPLVDNVDVELEGSHRHVTCGALANDTVISLRRRADCVKPPQWIQSLSRGNIDTFAMSHKIDALKSKYTGWRAVRGDGNCYYRAVYYGLLEQIIQSNSSCRLQRFSQLLSCFKSVVYNDPVHTSEHQHLLQLLTLAKEGKCWRTTGEFEADILASNELGCSNLDVAIIRSCRGLVAEYLLHHRQLMLSELTVEQAILPLYQDVSSMEEYCDKYCLTMGVAAEGPFVDLGLLLLALDCTGVIVYLDDRDEVELSTFCSERFTETNTTDVWDVPAICIYLLLRASHYDLLYPITAPSPLIRRGDASGRLATPHSLQPGVLENDVNMSAHEGSPSIVYGTTGTERESALYTKLVGGARSVDRVSLSPEGNEHTHSPHRDVNGASDHSFEGKKSAPDDLTPLERRLRACLVLQEGASADANEESLSRSQLEIYDMLVACKVNLSHKDMILLSTQCDTIEEALLCYGSGMLGNGCSDSGSDNSAKGVSNSLTSSVWSTGKSVETTGSVLLRVSNHQPVRRHSYNSLPLAMSEEDKDAPVRRTTSLQTNEFGDVFRSASLEDQNARLWQEPAGGGGSESSLATSVGPGSTLNSKVTVIDGNRKSRKPLLKRLLFFI